MLEPAFEGYTKKEAENTSTPLATVILYVKLHTSREPELYTMEVFTSTASADTIEEVCRSEGGRAINEPYGDFSYIRSSKNELSIHGYTFTGPEGYLDYDIGWIEEIIYKAETLQAA